MLTRATVTAASRIMLPTHIALSGIVGAAWALQDPERTNVPALAALRHVWPIAGTGVVLLVLAAVEIVALLSHNRALAAVAIGAGFLTYLVLAVAVAWPLHPHVHLAWPLVTVAPGVSVAAWAWIAYPAMAHLSTLVSLANDELTDAGGNRRVIV